MRDRFGVDQFKVITIGFNQPTDSPMAMNAFALQQQIDDENWKFLSPHPADVDPLAQAFGFSYVATPVGFEHTMQVSILDDDGRIRNQVYGAATRKRRGSGTSVSIRVDPGGVRCIKTKTTTH